MVKHREVAQSWANGMKDRGSRMFTDGITVWSYGTHWPLATWISRDEVLLNVDKYSSSTSNHFGYVKQAITSDVTIYETDANTIIDYLNNPSKPIIIVKEKEIDDFDDIIELLKTYMKNKGIKRFPKKQIKEYLRNLLLARLV